MRPAWHDQVGTIRDVRFVNILAHGENGVFIAGQRPGLVRGIVLDGVQVRLGSWSGREGGHYDRRPFEGGEAIYAHPTSAIHIDTAADVTIRDCEVEWPTAPAPWFAHAIEAIDVDGLTLERMRGSSACGVVPAIVQRRRDASGSGPEDDHGVLPGCGFQDHADTW